MDVDNALVKVKNGSGGLTTPQRWSAREAPEAGKDQKLRNGWYVLLKHRWLILTCFLVTTATATTATLMQQPEYKAAATIRIETAAPKVLKFDETAPMNDNETDDYYQTQYKLLGSYSLAERVVRLLSLDTNPDFMGSGAHSLTSTLRTWFAGLASLLPRQSSSVRQTSDGTLAVESPIVEGFLSKLDIEPVKNTRLVRIAFLSPSPELSARVANAVAENFIEQDLEQKVGATKHAGDFLAQQIEAMRAKLEDSDNRLQQFAKQKQYLVLDEKQEQTTKQLSLLTDALMKARSERLEKEALYQQTQGQDVQSIPSVLENALIIDLKKEYFRLQAEYSKLSETFLPDYPRMVALQNNIDEVKRRLDGEVQKIIDGLQSSYEAAVKSEHLLQSSVDQQKQVTLKSNEDSIQYNILKREVDINRELYAGLLQRMKETAVSSRFNSTNIQITDRAKVPLSTDRPKKLLNVAVGIILGLGLGIGLAFFADRLDNTINKIEEVEPTFALPILGAVPALASVERRKRLRGATDSRDARSFDLIMHHDQTSLASEAIRNIRTSLLFSLPENPPNLLLVTSAEPDAGKTGVAVNLAIALSQLGGDTLLIDADMRCPDCHRILELDRTPGLSNFLVGEAELSAVIKPTAIPTLLYLLPAGQSPLNPAELLSSERMSAALNFLTQQFKYVIIDSPPVLEFTDSVLLSTLAEGTLFVIRAGATPRDAAQRAIGMLNGVNAKILGVVLNHLDLQNTGYSYYHDYDDYYHRKSEQRDAVVSQRDVR